MKSALGHLASIPALLASLGVAGACGSGEESATSTAATTGGVEHLHVLKSEMVSGREMRLVFDGPLASPKTGESGGFRLSIGHHVERGRYFRYCSDIDRQHGVEILASCVPECAKEPLKKCPDATACCDATFQSASTVHYPLDGFIAARRGDADDELVLRLGEGPPADACGALFLHFLPRSSAEEVRAVDGRTLDGFGSAQIAGGSTDETVILPDDGGDGARAVGTSVLAPLCAGHGCSDGDLDGSETDLDCGGLPTSGCAACADGKRCRNDGDCVSAACRANGPDLICAARGTPP